MRDKLSAETGLKILPPADPFEAQAARDALVEASGALKNTGRLADEDRERPPLHGLRPARRAGGDLPSELQKGSSIMPGKVNPVIPEVVTQVAAQVIGNDAAITIGGMQGHFELNVFVPLIARNLLDSIKLLASASAPARREVRRRDRGEPRAERALRGADAPPATALNPYIGYDRATEIVKEAARSGRSLREVARDAGVEESVLDEALDYRKMAKPHD